MLDTVLVVYAAVHMCNVRQKTSRKILFNVCFSFVFFFLKLDYTRNEVTHQKQHISNMHRRGDDNQARVRIEEKKRP